MSESETDPQLKIYNKINSLDPTNANGKIVCIYNKYRNKICYNFTQPNTIECDDEYCKINMKLPKSILSHNTKLPDGIYVGYLPENNIALFGSFKRNELDSILKMGITTQIKKSDNVFPTLGVPYPPKKCNNIFKIFSRDCRIYFENPDLSPKITLKPMFIKWVKK